MQLGVLVVLAVIASTASAQTTQPTLSATLGFAGVFKPDAWTPIYVRVADDRARPATIELRTTRGRVGHVISARVNTSTTPTTFTLYAPIGSLDHARVQLRDADGTLIREQDLTDAALATPAAFGGPVFGVSGDAASMQRVVNGLIRDTGEQVAAGSVSLKLLPDRPLGYSGLDVLVLPDLHTDAIDDSAETAIARWIRAGGIVISWPGKQVPSSDSPLGVLLPATVGEVVERDVNGQPLATRTLTARPNDVGVIDRSQGDESIFERRVGLGQIVWCSFDPTLARGKTPEERVAIWRALTSNQLRLLASERRNGLFDPLVAEARGDQALTIAPHADVLRPALAAALALALLMGAGELILLAAAARHPRTWYTLTGLLGTVVCGAALLCVPKSAASQARVDVIVEADDGEAISIALAADVERSPQAAWLASERLDPTRQSAGELDLGQRVDGFEVNDSVIRLSAPAARVRSIAWPDGMSATSQPAGEPNAVMATDTFSTTSRSSTGRIETGIEQLAARPGWEALLMDRGVASRLVALQEREGATIRVARSHQTDGERFVVHVTRAKN